MCCIDHSHTMDTIMCEIYSITFVKYPLSRAIFTPNKILKQFQDVFGVISEFSNNEGMDTMLPICIMAVVRAKLVLGVC